MVFANSRLHTEILLTYLQQANPRLPGKPETIRGYRGGYLPNERREIERGLRDGKIRGVVSTSALELGIDVGSLDTVVMAGYPGTIAATWQRAGRAGRRIGSSCAGAAFDPGLPGGRRRTVADWGDTAGMWSGRCRGCTTSEGCGSARIEPRPSIRRFSDLVAR